jgi:glycosidase
MEMHWMADQVVYEIFPDRYAIGQPYTSETKLQLPMYTDDAHHHGTDGDYKTRTWDQLPVNDPPDNPPMGKDFFGGDLDGIMDHLDHLQELGVTTLFLTPIFFSPSNHKYDTLDYFTVDEHFGGEAALRRLVQELRRRGLNLILDAVLNHVSDIHPWFLAAKAGSETYREFFTFSEDGSYLCWRNWNQQPEMNLSNPAVQNILFRERDSVLQKYLEMGIDGWRFDAAPDLGLDASRSISRVIKERFPNAALIGETTHFGAAWVKEDVFHGLMNYYFRSALLGWLGGEISARQMNHAAEEYFCGYGMAGALCSWNLLSSHDTARLKHVLPESWQQELAIVAQFTLPGVPVVYYGEEIGMEGGDDPDCRRPMVWDRTRWDTEALSLFRQVISIRKARRELRRGTFVSLTQRLDGDAIVFLRYTEVPQEVSLVVINRSVEPLRQRVMIPHSHLYHDLPMENLLAPGAPYVRMGQGYIDLDVPQQSAAILVPHDRLYPHYRFFKERMNI